jgi:hypothetical protein
MPRLSLKGRLIVSHGEQLFAIHRRWQFRFKGARVTETSPCLTDRSNAQHPLSKLTDAELEASEFFSASNSRLLA